MPTYSFRNTKTGKIKDVFMPMSEREDYLKKNPHLVQTQTKAIGVMRDSGIGRSRKPDEGFREVLRQVKKKHPGSNIDTF